MQSMETGITANRVLDHALFQVQSSRNRYEALACCDGQMENLGSGPLDQLTIHLPEAGAIVSNNNEGRFKLVVNDSANGSSWFTKSTLSRFLHIVNAGDMLENATAMENEMSQLEETKRFQVNLYAKDEGARVGGLTETPNNFGDARLSSDSTKNDLLLAMDLRLSVLKEDLVASFHTAAGSSCSAKEVSDLAAFAQHVGATQLRNFCLRILPLFLEAKTSDTPYPHSVSSDNRRDINGDDTLENDQLQLSVQKPAANNLSPAKIAEAERQCTTESEDSSVSNSEDEPAAERSRSLIRSASPRRSASPMRRIQIGRSGSRRSTALTIKSINYFPSRERTTTIRGADVSMSGIEESDQPTRKPENRVRRMSVQDAINLFESKQKDQSSDVQKRTSDIASVTNKSVLRRWSAGMGNSFHRSLQENTSDTGSGNDSNSVAKSQKEELKSGADNIIEPIEPVVNTRENASLEEDRTSSALNDPVIPKAEDENERVTASAEWTRQQEAELNQIILKMMESKHGNYRASNAVVDECMDMSNEHRGDFYNQHKEKRDEKLLSENGGKQAVKKAQLKVMKKTLEQSNGKKACMSNVTEKNHGSDNNLRRARRNSSSPMLDKKGRSKPFISRNASPKSSLLPTTPTSLSAGTRPRSSLTPQQKHAPSTTPNRWKSQSAPSPNRPSPKTEKPLQQPKMKYRSEANVKQSSQGKERSQQKAVAKSTKIKNKEPPTLEGISTVQASKPSFDNKVMRKGTVVPLEPKPFLRKGARSSPNVGASIAKAKIPQLTRSSKNYENPTQEEMESAISVNGNTAVELNGNTAAELNGNTTGDSQIRPTDNIDASMRHLEGNGFSGVRTDSPNVEAAAGDDALENLVENPSQEIQQDIQSDADLSISSVVWLEAERKEIPASETNLSELAGPVEPAPMPSTSPPRRHSLSQMLNADSCEPEIIEWGNAENPPAFIYQKDSPKGLKRLLKFARKSKGDVSVTGWSSLSLFSEGDDDQEESKATSRRTTDALLRNAIPVRSHGQQNNLLNESYDGGNSSKRSSYNQGSSMHRGNNTDATTSVKGSRSFFSLSTFRSSKSSDPKLRR